MIKHAQSQSKNQISHNANFQQAAAAAPQPRITYGAIAPGHAWYEQTGGIVARGHLLKSGKIKRTNTYTGHDAEFFIDRAAESDGGGYLASIRLTLGYTEIPGFEAAEDFVEEYARFSTLENCTAWIRERTRTKPD
jgi:hypothetical protein